MLSKISKAERREILSTIIIASMELGDAATEALRNRADGIEILSQIDFNLPPPEGADPVLTKGWRMMRVATQLVKTIDTLAPLFGMTVAEAFEFLHD